MLKRWFSLNGNGNRNGASSDCPRNPSSGSLAHLAEAVALQEKEGEPDWMRPSAAPAVPKLPPFEQIYQTAAVKPPQLRYGILKVMEMANSSHLSGMTPEAKRCALLMALDAAGAEVDDLLQDALVRQRALHDHEEKQHEMLNAFEAAKLEENRSIQEELDRLTSQYMARIQGNVDDVASQQDAFRDWKKRKQLECDRMTEIAAFLVPPGTNNGTLTAVLERSSGLRR
jgi:hypothetical protein